MLDNNTTIKLKNRAFGRVVYTIPDLGIRREFQPNEEKEVTMEELRKLSYLPGGMITLANELMIKNEDAVKEILGDVEPEYYYNEEQVKQILLNGSLEELEDCLDFAGAGVLNMVKNLAVELEINDIAKRKAIQDKTGLNVTNAININQASKEEDTAEETTIKTRRVPIKTAETATTSAPKRRTAPVTTTEK